MNIYWGLRRGPASPSQLIFVVGLPFGRASSQPFIWPPAWPASKYIIVLLTSGLSRLDGLPLNIHRGRRVWTGVPVSAKLRRGLPVPTGFPMMFHMASGVGRLP